MGLIPFYKDVRRIVMKEMFEDGVIQRREAKAKKERKKYMDYLKENDPDEYRFELREEKLNSVDDDIDDDADFVDDE